jgi:hypothetical protein
MSTNPFIVRTAVDGILTLTLNRPETRTQSWQCSFAKARLPA